VASVPQLGCDQRRDDAEIEGNARCAAVRRFAKSINAKVTALTVSPTFPTVSMDPRTVTDTPEQYRNDCDARAEKYPGTVEDAAEVADVPVGAAHVVHRSSLRAIINPAHRRDCDLIFMASHGRRDSGAGPSNSLMLWPADMSGAHARTTLGP